MKHCFAQGGVSSSTFNQWTYIGITAAPGFNFTRVASPGNMPEALRFIPMLTYAFGFAVRKDFSERLSNRVDITIERYGIRTQYGHGPSLGLGSSTTIFHHLKIPVTLQYRFSTIGRSRLFVSGGGGFLLSPGSNNDRFTASDNHESITWLASSYIKFNPMIAIGSERQTKRGYVFSLSLSYTLGLFDLRNYDYSFRQNGQVVFASHLHNRGTFLGFNGAIFLPPFGYKKLAIP